MSDIGLGGVDFSLGLENFNAELLEFGQTAEGQAQFDQLRQDLGIDPSLFGGGGEPVFREEPVTTEDDGETAEDRAIRLANEREDARNEAIRAGRIRDARSTMASPFLPPTV
jgi:hypothetical protein